jgi:hypothetical protein
MRRTSAIGLITLSVMLTGCGDPIVTGPSGSADQGSGTTGTRTLAAPPAAQSSPAVQSGIPAASPAAGGDAAPPRQQPARVPAPNPTSSIPIPGNRPDPGPTSSQIDPPSTKPE